jgi:hypothetical protein
LHCLGALSQVEDNTSFNKMKREIIHVADFNVLIIYFCGICGKKRRTFNHESKLAEEVAYLIKKMTSSLALLHMHQLSNPST